MCVKRMKSKEEFDYLKNLIAELEEANQYVHPIMINKYMNSRLPSNEPERVPLLERK